MSIEKVKKLKIYGEFKVLDKLWEISGRWGIMPLRMKFCSIVTNMVFSLSPDFCVVQATESRAMVAICRNLFIFSSIVVTKL